MMGAGSKRATEAEYREGGCREGEGGEEESNVWRRIRGAGDGGGETGESVSEWGSAGCLAGEGGVGCHPS